jgi:glycosyltransferase involved in cell wall biosynthesis
VKILFLNITAAVGGAERLLLDLMTSLRQADPSLSLHLAVGENGPMTDEARQRGVAVTILPIPQRLREFGESGLQHAGPWSRAVHLAGRGLLAGWATWQYRQQLRRLVASLRPDVVHSNSLKFHLLSPLAAQPGPLLVWQLQDFVGARPVLRPWLRVVAGRVSGIVAITQAVADDARRHVAKVPVTVVFSAVDTDHFSPGENRGQWLDELAGLSAGPAQAIRVGLVATYARWKGQDVFLEAATRLLRRRPDLPLRFHVVGGPIYHTRGSQWSVEELRQRAGEAGRDGRIGFVPFQSDAAPVYRSLDVVVHASTRPEPFGLTIAEAMACGRAVVVARAGGAAELFTHDHDAIGVRPGDPAELASVLESLVEDPQRRRRLEMAARATALTRFARSRLGPQVLAAYRHFGGGSSARVVA